MGRCCCRAVQYEDEEWNEETIPTTLYTIPLGKLNVIGVTANASSSSSAPLTPTKGNSCRRLGSCWRRMVVDTHGMRFSGEFIVPETHYWAERIDDERGRKWVL